ncbi:hypothetical protein [Nocardioides sp. HB32]
MRRLLASLTVLLCAVPLAACGASDSGGGSDGSSPSDPKIIQVTFDGDSVTPNGERVDVSVGQPVTLQVTADAPGEIHVHSTPEQELEYGKGETTLKLTPIEAPGTVDVESHSLEKVIVQLEVR